MISKYMKVEAKDHLLQECEMIQDELKKENEIFQNNCTSYGNSNGVEKRVFIGTGRTIRMVLANLQTTSFSALRKYIA